MFGTTCMRMLANGKHTAAASRPSLRLISTVLRSSSIVNPDLGLRPFLSYSNAGTRFVFGALADAGFSIFVNVLPIIIFSGCFFSVLYHLGILQRIINGLSFVLARTMRLSGAESLCAVANLFVGITEAALVVRPYLARMTRSELFSLMTLGMATVAGSVMLAYVGMLGGGDYAGHLATASLLSAPAGLSPSPT